MKIYTKTGDKGFTSLIGGSRVMKNTPQIEAYGTLDELNAHIGVLENFVFREEIVQELQSIQNFLFQIGAYLATDIEKTKPALDSSVLDENISFLEQKIDERTDSLPAISEFILPEGAHGAAFSHLCRTVCRRLERRMYDVSDLIENEKVLIYVNRLSDYFFVLARYIVFLNGNKEIFRE